MSTIASLKSSGIVLQPIIHVYNGVPGFQADNDLVNCQGNRKAMIGEIFIIYMLFLGLKFVYKNPMKPQRDQSDGLGNQSFDYYEKRFMVLYTQHILLQLPAIMYSASVFSVVVIYLYLLVFLLLLLGCKKENNNLIYSTYGFCCFLNMLNYVVGLGSLGKVGENTVNNLKTLKALK